MVPLQILDSFRYYYFKYFSYALLASIYTKCTIELSKA